MVWGKFIDFENGNLSWLASINDGVILLVMSFWQSSPCSLSPSHSLKFLLYNSWAASTCCSFFHPPFIFLFFFFFSIFPTWERTWEFKVNWVMYRKLQVTSIFFFLQKRNRAVGLRATTYFPVTSPSLGLDKQSLTSMTWKVSPLWFPEFFANILSKKSHKVAVILFIYYSCYFAIILESELSQTYIPAFGVSCHCC